MTRKRKNPGIGTTLVHVEGRVYGGQAGAKQQDISAFGKRRRIPGPGVGGVTGCSEQR